MDVTLNQTKGNSKKIQELYHKKKDGVFTMEEVGVLNHLEGRKESLLLEEEYKWRRKSRSVWLKSW